MGILGKKLNKSKFVKLGHKIDNNIHKMGQKTNDVLDKVENANKKIISKSGKALNVGKKILGVGDKLVTALNDAGLEEVPIVGNASGILEKGLHNGHKGLEKLDKLHDKYEKASNKAIKTGRNVGTKLEKHNTRKALAQMAKDEVSNFV